MDLNTIEAFHFSSSSINPRLTDIDRSIRATHLLILLLFFLDPNSPWMKIIGCVSLFGTVGFSGE